MTAARKRSHRWECSFCGERISDYDVHIVECSAKPRDCRCPENFEGIHERGCESLEARANDFASSAVYRITETPRKTTAVSITVASVLTAAVLVLCFFMFIYYVWNHTLP